MTKKARDLQASKSRKNIGTKILKGRIQAVQKQDAINETLSTIENQVIQAENTLKSRHDIVTLGKVLMVVEDDKPTITLFDLFYEHNKKMKERVGIDVANGTYKIYARIEKQVKQFVKDTYDKDDIYLSELNLKFIEDLEHWWKQNSLSLTTPHSNIWGNSVRSFLSQCAEGIFKGIL